MKLSSPHRFHRATAILAAAMLGWSVPTLSLHAEDPAPAAATEAAPAAPAAPEAPDAPAPVENPESATPPAADIALEVETPATTPAAVEAPTPESDEWNPRHRRELVTIRGDAHLLAEESVPDMVTVMGNAIVDGVVNGDCVTVLGNVTVNGRVRGELVCIGGTITLGPGAEVRGEVVAVGGPMRIDPSARIRGEKIAVSIPGLGPWIGDWFQDGLGQARVLPHNHRWAWTTAFVIVGLNLLFAVMFREAITASARAVETRPVFAVVNGALVLLLVPVLFILLAASVVGIPLIPVAMAGLFLCWFLGTIGVFYFCGQQFGFADRPVVAVLVGNLVFVLLYALPVVGFAVWSVTGLIGLGAAVTALGARRREIREARAAARREDEARRAQTPVPPSVAPHVEVSPTNPVYMAPPAPVAAPQPPPVTPAVSMGFVGTDTPPSMPQGAMPVYGSAAEATFQPPVGGWVPPVPPLPQTPSMPPTGASVSVPPLPSDDLNERATFGPRLLAVLLDIFVVTMTLAFLGLVAGPTWVLGLLAYHTFFWAWRGTTPGGIVLNLKVVRDDRAPMDFKVAAVRALSGVFSMVPAGLGLIWVAFDRDAQSWHDKLAGTSVVTVRKSAPLV